jgi:phosphohistidine phosphatase
MKTLLLVRHAKAEPAALGQSDHDRSLDKRGIGAAQDLAQHLVKEGVKVDCLLVSSAKRTCMTASLLLEAISVDPAQVRVLDSLYLASAQHLMDRIHKTDDDIDTLMIIGHNPGLEDLANAFYPVVKELGTAQMVHVTLNTAQWALTHPSLVLKGQLVN